MQPINLSNFTDPAFLGRGSFHNVYSIKDKRTSKMFSAIVRIYDEKDLDEQLKKSINEEVQIIQQLNHPTIIKFFGYSLTDFKGENKFTLISEYATNGSLREILKKEQKGIKQLDDTSKQIILIGTARALQYLHQHRIAHLNVKPDKVLLDDDFKPHLSGFELAEFIDDHEINPKGTPMYMSPEIILCDQYGLESDVYSFSILMYEVVTGSSPYHLDEISHTFKFQKSIVDGLRPKFECPVKPKVKELIEKCWEMNPKDRPNFETIFDLLSQRRNSCNVFEENQKREYYISDNVDDKKVRLYVDEIMKNDNLFLVIEELKETISQLKKENEEMKKEINEIKKNFEDSNK